MKKLVLLLILCFAFLDVMGQKDTVYSIDLTPYVGTWVYENQDTVFTIKWQMAKDTAYNRRRIVLYVSDCLVGGYSLKVNGVETDNYIKELPTGLSFFSGKNDSPKSNVYLSASYLVRKKSDLQNFDGKITRIKFYDQRKKHNNGDGFFAGGMELLAPDKLHWWLEDEEKVQLQQGADGPLVGYSVPTNAVMRKVE